MATISIEQEIHNPNPQRLEGTFLFPIPKGAHLEQFQMEIGGKMVEPELLSAEKARKIYEEIVRKAKDPALLEFAEQDCLRVRIFPIEGRSRKKIALKYTQVLKMDSGLAELAIPITADRYSAKPIPKLSLAVEIRAGSPLKTIYSPTHPLDLSRPTPTTATLALDERVLAGNHDFRLLYGFETGDVAIRALTHRAQGEEGYYMLFASPGIDAADSAVVAKDVAFVLDTSGSMSGKKLEQAKKALLFCVRNLNEKDRFEVIRFATETEGLFRELRPSNAENVAMAERFIDGLKAMNGTAIDDALREALSLRGPDLNRPFAVIFLTDGLPTVGETREGKIIGNITERAQATRIFCFGIGLDVNTHLLDKVAEQTRAFAQYVTPGEDIEVKVSSFFSKIRDPLLANVRLSAKGADIRLSKQHPGALPDLFRGEQLIAAGRYQGSGKATVTLEGAVNGELRKFSAEVDFPGREPKNEFLPRIWATRRVGALLDQIRLNGENKELRDEVTELARQFGIATPYTSFLIMEDEALRGVPERAQTLPQPARTPAVREEARMLYRRFQLEKSGDEAVAAAQTGQALRSADNIAEQPRFIPSTRSPQPSPALARGSSGPVGASPTAEIESRPARFVDGRNFHQNGKVWMDTRLQRQKDLQRQRIQFGGEEYFEFARKNRSLSEILSLGANLEFVHGGVIVEIHE